MIRICDLLLLTLPFKGEWTGNIPGMGEARNAHQILDAFIYFVTYYTRTKHRYIHIYTYLTTLA
jgi:hypothetical protein